MSDQAPPLFLNRVSVIRQGDQWTVQVIEGGQVHERTFSFEAHAASFADGQRLRLGLFQGLPAVDFFQDHHTN